MMIMMTPRTTSTDSMRTRLDATASVMERRPGHSVTKRNTRLSLRTPWVNVSYFMGFLKVMAAADTICPNGGREITQTFRRLPEHGRSCHPHYSRGADLPHGTRDHRALRQIAVGHLASVDGGHRHGPGLTRTRSAFGHIDASGDSAYCAHLYSLAHPGYRAIFGCRVDRFHPPPSGAYFGSGDIDKGGQVDPRGRNHLSCFHD